MPPPRPRASPPTRPPARRTNPDGVVFITDGNPTVNDTDQGGNGSDVSLFDLTAGMASANKVKNQDGRPLVPGPGDRKVQMFAIGVDNEAGSAPTAANLKVVSGPVEGVDGDYATPTITQLNTSWPSSPRPSAVPGSIVRKHITSETGTQQDWLYTAATFRPRPERPSDLPGRRPLDPSTTADPPMRPVPFFTSPADTPTTVNVEETGRPAGQSLPTFELTDVDCRSDSYDGAPSAPGGCRRPTTTACRSTAATRSTAPTPTTPTDHARRHQDPGQPDDQRRR